LVHVAEAMAVGTRTSVKNTSLKRRAGGIAAADLDAGRLHVDDEAGEALVLGEVGVGAADDLADVAVLGAGGPDLLAGDDPLSPSRLALV
jgi:hypothetical protein